MTLHYLDKQRAGANIAHVLLARGWELRGYHADRSDSSSDYYSPASWGDGIATHPDYPGVVVGFDVGAKRAEARSGQDETTTNYERTEDCVACAGSGACRQHVYTRGTHRLVVRCGVRLYRYAS